MAITAADVNKLRQATGAGMMDCKKALQEANGDFEAAIDNLRKKGQKVSAKRAEHEANEGVAIARTTPDNKKGIVFKLTSETDFVAKNADFIQVAERIAEAAVRELPGDAEALKNLRLDGNKTVDDLLNDQRAKIGEKIDVVDYHRLDAETVVAYNHAGNRVGVLIGLNKPASEDIVGAAKDAAMQVAAMNPVAVDKDRVEQSIVERELEIAREQIRAEGKPDHMLDKIAQGKLNKFFKDSTLLQQDFVKDTSKTVGQMLQSVSPELTVTQFYRVALGN